MKRLLIFFICSTVLSQIYAQRYNGNWDAYLMEVNKKPVSIVVDLDFGSSVEAKQRPNVIIVSIQLNDAREDGMPGKEELRILDSLENELVNMLRNNLNAIYAGRYTLNGKRDFYFYTNDTSNCRSQIKLVFQSFPSYTWELKVKPDADLGYYKNVLYPTPREMERIQNHIVVDDLRKKGDLLKAPRKIDHFIFFKTEADRKRFAGIVQDSGFVVESAGQEIGINGFPFTLQVSRTDKVDYNSIDHVSLFLWELAMQHFGKYNGWETFVVKGEE
ncbi:MAG TPA: DUF695 domain-containing protein [Agriterribacter sp.]|nr:DUF695 domain-containing protein [Agriterribacter sp.]